ncbi:AfsR/SARP family transcriptional regulator, partial [Streptomyces bambusae]
VGRLRRALGHAAVASSDGGYRLTAGRGEIDLFRFEDLARGAARALAEADPGRAAALYDEALALWRGPALADLPEPEPEAGRWEAVRLQARRGRLAAALALGGADRVLPEIGALCAEHPLDEPLQALRLRALRDTGRPAEALAAYDHIRRTLADRLGTDPGPELRALHEELLTPITPTPSPSPAAPPSPAPSAAPSPSASPHPSAALAPPPAPPGAPAPGPQDSAPQDLVPPAEPLPAPPRGNLRARLTTFVGREEDIRVIGEDLSGHRLVTLLGPGGAGKTRLSQEAAEAHAGDGGWPDGVWLVELAPVDDPDDVPEAALAAVGARETKLRGAAAEELRALAELAGAGPMARLVEHCGRRRLLLVLDNCEHVVGAAAALAEELLARCPGVRILATSREPLGVPGEFVRPVEPLPPAPALRLLADRGASARAGFTVEADPAAAAEICRRLDGLPLAIELAAARLRLLTPRQIADRLDDRFRLLTSGSRTVLPRQQTLRAVVDWSWDLLDEAERTVLRRLSVFAGGCDLAAAEAVCADARPDTRLGTRPDTRLGTRLDALDVADVLGSLVDKSLVVAAPAAGGEMRYRLLETVAEYAAERLTGAGAGSDRRETERRHLTHYRELARTTDPLLRRRGQRAAAQRLDTEYENLRTALRRAVAAHEVDEVLCLVHSLAWYWHMHDLRSESRHWSNAAAALGPDPFAPPAAPAPPVHTRIVDAPPPYSGDVLTEAWRGIRLMVLATRDQHSGSWDRPEARAEVASIVAAYRPGLPQTCRTPGAMWIYAVMIAGDVDMLHKVVHATVDTARANGYRWELASALQLRANVLANRPDHADAAARDAEESLAVFQELGDDWGCAEALSARAESLERRGEYALAARDFRAAIDYARRLGAQAQVTVLRVRLAGVLLESGGETGTGTGTEAGTEAEAEEILTGILRTSPEYGNEAVPAARIFLAVWYGRTGRVPEGRAQLQLLRDEFAFGAYAIFDCVLLGAMGWLDNLEGRHEDALAKAREALAVAEDPLARMVAPHMPAVFLSTAAEAYALLGGPDRARTAALLLGAYAAHLPAGHFPVTTERETRERVERLARAELGGSAYEAAYAEGGDLTVKEATALV